MIKFLELPQTRSAAKSAFQSLADNLSGEPFETAQLRHDREKEDAMVDVQEEPGP
jgi:hypothetical protein